MRVDILDSVPNALREYPDNSICTSKYTILSFLPLNLFEQFRKLSNFYFLVLMVLTLIPGATPVDPVSTIVPLVVVVAVAAVKDAFEDYKRHRSDKLANTQLATVLRNGGKWTKIPSEAIQVGDVLRIHHGEEIRADCLLLNSSLPDGLAYIETSNLDGETNAKTKRAKEFTVQHLGSVEQLLRHCNVRDPTTKTIPQKVVAKIKKLPRDIAEQARSAANTVVDTVRIGGGGGNNSNNGNASFFANLRRRGSSAASEGSSSVVLPPLYSEPISPSSHNSFIHTNSQNTSSSQHNHLVPHGHHQNRHHAHPHHHDHDRDTTVVNAAANTPNATTAIIGLVTGQSSVPPAPHPPQRTSLAAAAAAAAGVPPSPLSPFPPPPHPQPQQTSTAAAAAHASSPQQQQPCAFGRPTDDNDNDNSSIVFRRSVGEEDREDQAHHSNHHRAVLNNSCSRSAGRKQSAWILAELPDSNLAHWQGQLRIGGGKKSLLLEKDLGGDGGEDDETVPLGLDNFLFRGATLRNTEYVIAVVVYTGVETKMFLNLKQKPPKRSQFDQQMNQLTLFLFISTIVLALIMSSLAVVWRSSQQDRTPDGNDPWYLEPVFRIEPSLAATFGWRMITHCILFSNLIPISLFLTLKMNKGLQILFISWDNEMATFDEKAAAAATKRREEEEKQRLKIAEKARRAEKKKAKKGIKKKDEENKKQQQEQGGGGGTVLEISDGDTVKSGSDFDDDESNDGQTGGGNINTQENTNKALSKKELERLMMAESLQQWRLCRPKTSNLTSQLARVKYIFADKTGTLTENCMKYVCGFVDGLLYFVNDETAAEVIAMQQRCAANPSNPSGQRPVSSTSAAATATRVDGEQQGSSGGNLAAPAATECPSLIGPNALGKKMLPLGFVPSSGFARARYVEERDRCRQRKHGIFTSTATSATPTAAVAQAQLNNNDHFQFDQHPSASSAAATPTTTTTTTAMTMSSSPQQLQQHHHQHQPSNTCTSALAQHDAQNNHYSHHHHGGIIPALHHHHVSFDRLTPRHEGTAISAAIPPPTITTDAGTGGGNGMTHSLHFSSTVHHHQRGLSGVSDASAGASSQVRQLIARSGVEKTAAFMYLLSMAACNSVVCFNPNSDSSSSSSEDDEADEEEQQEELEENLNDNGHRRMSSSSQLRANHDMNQRRQTKEKEGAIILSGDEMEGDQDEEFTNDTDSHRRMSSSQLRNRKRQQQQQIEEEQQQRIILSDSGSSSIPAASLLEPTSLDNMAARRSISSLLPTTHYHRHFSTTHHVHASGALTLAVQRSCGRAPLVTAATKKTNIFRQQRPTRKIYEGQSLNEVALVSAAADNYFELVERNAKEVTIEILGRCYTYDIVAEMEFTPQRKLMSIILRRNRAAEIAAAVRRRDYLDKCLATTTLGGGAAKNTTDVFPSAVPTRKGSMSVGGVAGIQLPSFSTNRQSNHPQQQQPDGIIRSLSSSHLRLSTSSGSAIGTTNDTSTNQNHASAPHPQNTHSCNQPENASSSAVKMPGSALIDDQDDTLFPYLMLTKGADSSMLPLIDMSIQSNIDLSPPTEEALCEMATCGLRTLVLGFRRLSQRDVDDFLPQLKAAQCSMGDRHKELHTAYAKIECNFSLIGATAVEDKLQEGVPQTIDFFARAKVVVWMLTGDKRETAVTIGATSGIVDPQQSEVIHIDITGIPDDEKLAAVKQQLAHAKETVDRSPPNTAVLVIDGVSLNAALLVEDGSSDFFELGSRCRAAICCRMTPLQKADIVRLFQTTTGQVALAIGDGANDVSMIQEAEIGIGTMGLEGSQAELASDFAIPKFRHLKRLMVVHGRHCLYRDSATVLYSCYKNILMTILLACYGFVSGFSGQALFSSWLFAAFNLLYLQMHSFSLGIFDKDIDDDMLESNPHLYPELAEKQAYFRIGDWVSVSVECVFIGVTSFMCSYSHLVHQDLDVVHDAGLTDIGTIIFVAIVTFLDCAAAIRFLRTWTVITVGITILAFALIPVLTFSLASMIFFGGESSLANVAARVFSTSVQYFHVWMLCAGVFCVVSLTKYVFIDYRCFGASCTRHSDSGSNLVRASPMPTENSLATTSSSQRRPKMKRKRNSNSNHRIPSTHKNKQWGLELKLNTARPDLPLSLLLPPTWFQIV